MPLLSVNRVGPGQEDVSDVNQQIKASDLEKEVWR
jgi:hypothetical protein